MPRTIAKPAGSKPTEHEKPPEIAESAPNEQVHHDENKDPMEGEEVEYEEIEEEIEVEEEEEVKEEEAAQEENAAADGKSHVGDDNMKNAHEGEDEDDSDRQAELLALPHGSEVFIGGISDEASEEDVKRFCQSVGEVTTVSLMKSKDSSKNEAYALVTYRTKELATKAIKELDTNELKGRKVKCSTSHAKNKMFIGNVPCRWSKGDMRRAVGKVGPGVIKVILKKVRNSSYNRGFAFVEYYNHACGEYSRKKMSTPEFKLDSNAPIVSWAEPRRGESSPTSQNLPENVTKEQLKKLFEHNGQITRVVLPHAKTGHEKRYAFVHFKRRWMAMRALRNTERYELDVQVLDCSIARPSAEKKDNAVDNYNRVGLLPLPSYSPFGYGVMPGAYGVIPAAYPVTCGRRTPGLRVPLMLPDGRLGQPGQPAVAPQQRGGTRSISDSRRGGRYRPY